MIKNISLYLNLLAKFPTIAAIKPPIIIEPKCILLILSLLWFLYLVSFPNNSSTLTFKVFDNASNCSGFGDVSPNSQLDIVCLDTSIFSASCSCEKLFFFLKDKIFLFNFIFVPPKKIIYLYIFALLLNSFIIIAKVFNIFHKYSRFCF